MGGKWHLLAFALFAACGGARVAARVEAPAGAASTPAAPVAAGPVFAIGKPECPDRDECMLRCESDHSAACVMVGRYDERDGASARIWFKHGCDAGSQEACLRLDSLPLPKGVLPLGQLERACTRGIAEACERLGWIYERGVSGVPVDAARGAARYRSAAERYQAACDAGSGFDCSGAAALHDDGAGVARDAAKADQLYARACELGDAWGCERSGASTTSTTVAEGVCKDAAPGACNRVGLRFEIGRELELDPVRAVASYQKACAANDPHGCALLGFAYEVGIGVARSLVKADELYGEACGKGEMLGCYGRARLHEQKGSVGITHDLELAAILYRRACKQSKDGLGCRELTAMYERGEAKNTDGLDVVQLYDDACLKADALACMRGAAMLVEGKKVARDTGRALGLYGSGCKLGHGPACYAAGKIHADGDLVHKDEEVAKEWFVRGCDLGDSESCVALGQLIKPFEPRLKPKRRN